MGGVRRIQRRRFGRDDQSTALDVATGRIKIGSKTTSESGVSIPQKINGFILQHEGLDLSNNPEIDFEAMNRLGFSKENIDDAIKDGFKASPDLLPQTLSFILMNDSSPEGDNWAYPGIFSERYECNTSIGLFCNGDGIKATRKKEDHSDHQVDCHPVGQTGCKAEDFCKFSVDGDCKMHARLTVCLFYIDKETGEPKMVSPRHGRQARFRFDTSSEYFSISVLNALDAASARVGGLISGLRGTLSYQRKARRTGKTSGGIPKANTGFVFFSIDEDSILQKEQEIARVLEARFQRQVECKERGLIEDKSAPSAIIPAEIDAEIIDVEPESEGLKMVREIGRVLDEDGDQCRQTNRESMVREIKEYIETSGRTIQEVCVWTFKGKKYSAPTVEFFLEGQNEQAVKTRTGFLEEIYRDVFLTGGAGR